MARDGGMTYISLFSGIEAASVAWGPLGWEPLAFCEVDEFPSAVLAHRYPDVPNLGDITKVDWKEVIARHGRPDVVVGGSPCQSFSIAGGRESLGGESRLMFEYIRACEEIHSPWIVWENVPGVLSTKDDAFGQLVDSLQDIGYVSLAWRVLDAQFVRVADRDGDGRIARWVGPVAQRRRRVFLVGHLGEGGRAAAVLFERESVRGNTQTSQEKRKALASDAAGGAAVPDGGSLGFAWHAGGNTGMAMGDDQLPTLTASGETPAVMRTGGDGHERLGDSPAYALNRQIIPDGTTAQGPVESCEVCPTLDTHSKSHGVAYAVRMANTSANGSGIQPELAHTLDTSLPEMVSFAQNTRNEVRVQGDGTISGALSAQPGMKQQPYIAQRVVTQYGEEIAETLTARHDGSPCADRGENVVCMADDTQNASVDDDLCGTLKVGGSAPLIARSGGVPE